MAEEQQVQVKLEEIFLASRKVRFLHLESSEDLIFRAKLCGEHMPMFLGADVLSKCSISVPNLPRTHAKFAKKGLATKVNFPSFLRINGIQGTAKGVWFYSIQGLFRVAFEMYSREEQLDVLKVLQGVWTLRFKDQLLGQSINPLRTDLCKNEKERIEYVKGESNIKDIPASVECCSQCDTNQNSTASACPRKINTILAKQVSKNNVENAGKRRLPHWKNKEILPELTDLSTTNDSFGNYSSEFDVIVDILRTLLQNYMAAAHSPEFSLLDHKQKFLYTMACCVGNDFKKCKEEISQRVTEFKKKHIATIDSLPPANQVINELFPSAMIVLLKIWMSDENQNPQEDSLASLPYPLIQLILEFANQTLVSGVAHVLYSRLIRTDSV